jgi:hypothetical protein
VYLWLSSGVRGWESIWVKRCKCNIKTKANSNPAQLLVSPFQSMQSNHSQHLLQPEVA